MIFWTLHLSTFVVIFRCSNRELFTRKIPYRRSTGEWTQLSYLLLSFGRSFTWGKKRSRFDGCFWLLLPCPGTIRLFEFHILLGFVILRNLNVKLWNFYRSKIPKRYPIWTWNFRKKKNKNYFVNFQGKTLRAEGRDDAADLAEIRSALKVLMFKEHEIWNIFKVLAAILHIGNVKFKGSTTYMFFVSSGDEIFFSKYDRQFGERECVWCGKYRKDRWIVAGEIHLLIFFQSTSNWGGRRRKLGACRRRRISWMFQK